MACLLRARFMLVKIMPNYRKMTDISVATDTMRYRNIDICDMLQCFRCDPFLHGVSKGPVLSPPITLTYFNRFSLSLAHMYYKIFAIRRCILDPPCVAVCVTALPCKISITTIIIIIIINMKIVHEVHKNAIINMK